MSEEIIRKTYLCPIIGTGTMVNPWRAKIADLGLNCSWFMHELTSNLCLVTVVAAASDHDKIALEADFELIMVKDVVSVDSDRFDALTIAYPKFPEKLDVNKKCSVKFMEVTGE